MSKKVLFMNTVMRFSRVLILLVLFGFFAISTDTFCTWSNIKNIVSQQVPFLMILSIGMTVAIILKGVDLSVGSVLALSSCIAALILQATGNVLLCIISGLVVGSLCGFINGIMIAKIGVSAYIATYTMQWIAKGIAYVLLAGGQVFNLDTNFRSIFIGWSYMLLAIAMVIAAVMLFLMNATTFGRNVYVIGNNPKAARLAGVHVESVHIICYTIIGFLSSLTGLMYIANLNAAEPVIGDNFPIKAIAASLIGGASFGGGKGNIYNSIIGSCIMIILTNGLLQLGVSSYWQQAAIGFVIVLSIIFERFLKRFDTSERVSVKTE